MRAKPGHCREEQVADETWGVGRSYTVPDMPKGAGRKLVPMREQESENMGQPGSWGPGLQLRRKTDALISLTPFWRSVLLSFLNYYYYF